MTPYRAAAVVAITVAAGICASVAADTALAAPDAPQNASARHDLQKLSDQGTQAFQDIETARLAIFNGHPQVAVRLIRRAQQSLIEAEADGTAFDKAEADLHPPPGQTHPAPADNASTTRWLPIGANLSLDTAYQGDPTKIAAVAAADAYLKKGERSRAIETLRLADIDVTYALAVVPVKNIEADVDEAADLLAHGKYYEANLSLKQAQDSVRHDWVDLNAARAEGAATPKNGLKEPVTSSVRDAEPEPSDEK
ncbi:YfdX family protein [Dyella mobilis]|uniref:YfdX family protein n=1 Tax=Dyella mobilis TaxID=1849582 RepID=A0ABS2KDQ1_9GAMM|nr:YfdX family protein [Dyella mobilis]MBM7129300.1 YfdX family protein [Dyella mobilis]